MKTLGRFLIALGIFTFVIYSLNVVVSEMTATSALQQTVQVLWQLCALAGALLVGLGGALICLTNIQQTLEAREQKSSTGGLAEARFPGALPPPTSPQFPKS